MKVTSNSCFKSHHLFIQQTLTYTFNHLLIQKSTLTIFQSILNLEVTHTWVRFVHMRTVQSECDLELTKFPFKNIPFQKATWRNFPQSTSSVPHTPQLPGIPSQPGRYARAIPIAGNDSSNIIPPFCTFKSHW